MISNVNNVINELSTLSKVKDFVFVCIGTDKHINDSVGPMTGSFLELSGYKVYGTLGKPVTAINYSKVRKGILEDNKEAIIIAVDACITKDSEAHGNIIIKKKGIKPGLGVGKVLDEIGDYSIVCNIYEDNINDNSISFPFYNSLKIYKTIKKIIG